MANSIGLAEEYTAELDVVYAKESLTSNLEVDNAMVRGFDNAGTVHLPDIVTDGLGDYDRDNGFSRGSTTLTWSPYTIDFDRAQEFQIDNLDDQESQNVAFAGTSTEFVRTQVVPEVDATRFAVMHTAANTKVEADLADGDAVLTAWDTAMLTMDNDEVGRETRLSYMSYDNLSKLKNASSIEREFQTQMINGMEVNREIWKLDGGNLTSSKKGDVKLVLDQKSGDVELTGYMTVKDYWGGVDGLNDDSKGRINGAVNYDDNGNLEFISLAASFYPGLADGEDPSEDDYAHVIRWEFISSLITNNNINALHNDFDSSSTMSYVIWPPNTHPDSEYSGGYSFTVTYIFAK